MENKLIKIETAPTDGTRIIASIDGELLFSVWFDEGQWWTEGDDEIEALKSAPVFYIEKTEGEPVTFEGTWCDDCPNLLPDPVRDCCVYCTKLGVSLVYYDGPMAQCLMEES